jgi:hypothetical protein
MPLTFQVAIFMPALSFTKAGSDPGQTLLMLG